jgi:endo-alpha-1,4-polygalactosaminidase (GH114 family)
VELTASLLIEIQPEEAACVLSDYQTQDPTLYPIDYQIEMANSHLPRVTDFFTRAAANKKAI